MSRIPIKFSAGIFSGRDGRVGPNCGFQSPQFESTGSVGLEDFQRAMSDPKFRDDLVSNIAHKNKDVILKQYDFLCCNCDNEATDMRIATADLLDRAPPQVIVTLAYPVCKSEQCNLVALQRKLGVFASMEKEDGMDGFYSKSPVECSACGKTAVNLLTCSRCKALHYCNRECQRKMWPEHKKVCKAPDSSQEFAHCL